MITIKSKPSKPFRVTLLKLLIMCCLLNFFPSIYAQKKKMMNEEHIKTQVIWREGKNIKYKFQELRFDKNGNRTEEIRYNPKGKIIFHKAYEFSNELLKREIELDPKGNITQRIDYSYVHNVLTSKKTLNGKGEVLLDEQYIYEYQN